MNFVFKKEHTLYQLRPQNLFSGDFKYQAFVNFHKSKIIQCQTTLSFTLCTLKQVTWSSGRLGSM